jgi:uncharacterized protein (TIGR04255 family)
MSLPKKISPCPIIESVVEIRFESDFPPEVIIGMLYKSFVPKFTKVDKLPILQLPEALRLTDPNLMFQPYYRLTTENFAFQFGAKVITLNTSGTYVGWDIYYAKLVETITEVVKSGIIKNILRYGIRYINFFETIDIYKNITLEVKMNDAALDSTQLLTRAELSRGKFMGVLQVASNADIILIPGRGKTAKKGSIIDIDIGYNKSENIANIDFPPLLRESHEEEKKLFFGLLKPDFLKTLSPVRIML